MKKLITLSAALGLSFASHASLISESFTGSFDNDESRFYVTFDVTQDNTLVTLESFSYAGGVNGEGVTLVDGGFDSQLFIFDGAGILLEQDDDDASRVSASSGNSWDALINRTLNIGSYTVALTQYNSDYLSGDLISGNWSTSGRDNFRDSSGSQRTSAYAFDISGLNLANITPVGHNTTPSPVSEPGTLALLAISVFGVAARRRKQK